MFFYYANREWIIDDICGRFDLLHLTVEALENALVTAADERDMNASALDDAYAFIYSHPARKRRFKKWLDR